MQAASQIDFLFGESSASSVRLQGSHVTTTWGNVCKGVWSLLDAPPPPPPPKNTCQIAWQTAGVNGWGDCSTRPNMEMSVTNTTLTNYYANSVNYANITN